MKNLFILFAFILFSSNFLFSQDVSFDEDLVATGVNKNSSVFAADIDGDGYKDIVGNSFQYNDIYWWKNDGTDQSNWTRYTIDPNFNGAQYLFSEDIDGDGRMDILATGCIPDESQVAWWHNDGGDPVGWTREVIREDFDNAHGIFAKDVNGDGNMDVIATAPLDSIICWWENDGNYPDINWIEHNVDSTEAGSQCVMSSDIDKDGDNDIIASVDSKVMLYLNDGQNPVHWTHLEVDSNCGWSHWVDTADFNNDGFIDIVSANYMENYLKWYENDGEVPIEWTEHTVSGYFPHGLTAYTADINNDGNLDIVGTALKVSPDWCDISWWENNGGESISFTKHTLSSNFTYPWGLFAADMDNDDDNDIIVGSNYLNRIIWFENGLYTNGIKNNEDDLFNEFSLNQNYPNPFNPHTSISYSLKTAEQVDLTIYNSLGQKIKTLIQSVQTPGDHIISWDGRNEQGHPVPSGTYFYKIKAGENIQTKKMIILK